MRELFEYAVIRVVPRVERGEFANVGVVLYCQRSRYLDLRCRFDASRLWALDPYLDADAVLGCLAAFAAVCHGGASAGPAGQTGPGERFRWLTAPRSTVVQTSPVHTGLTDDAERELDRLLALLVDPPTPPTAGLGTHVPGTHAPGTTAA
jgi:hypothetical protein